MPICFNEFFSFFWGGGVLQKKKFGELDNLNKEQELKFTTYVNGMYFLPMYQIKCCVLGVKSFILFPNKLIPI